MASSTEISVSGGRAIVRAQLESRLPEYLKPHIIFGVSLATGTIYWRVLIG
jgi:hypothetical protein